MPLFEVFLLAFGLAMDALAVSISVGVTDFLSSRRARFRISFHFGLFQGLMPILGWFAGSTIESFIRSFDHWVAFLLLGWVAGKMIKESFDTDQKEYQIDPSRGWSLIMLSIATSIDAFAVGLSLSIVGLDIFLPALLIGLITAVLSLIGIVLGNMLGQKFGRRIEFIGGLVLLFIGLKILLSHLLL
jgi:putative Mn2+ efflux pump MntP